MNTISKAQDHEIHTRKYNGIDRTRKKGVRF